METGPKSYGDVSLLQIKKVQQTTTGFLDPFIGNHTIARDSTIEKFTKMWSEWACS
jgi:hypothetical protein